MPESLTSATLTRILKKHGFVLTRQTGSHQIFRHPTTKRRVTLPFHRRDLPKGTLNEILKQAGLK